jgi:hypothetical protein
VLLEVQNSQVARYIAELVREGYARRITRKGFPRYRLTRVGLVELMTRAAHRSYVPQREHFFFLYYFINSYRYRFEQLVQAEGRSFRCTEARAGRSAGCESLVHRELEAARRELTKLESKVRDAHSTARLTRSCLSESRPLTEAVAEAQKRYPYI